MKKISYYLIVLFLIFLYEKILSSSHYIKYAIFYFIITFSIFIILNIKGIFNAFKYELLVRDNEAPFLITILKILSIIYYLIPFILLVVSFYMYNLDGSFFIMLIATYLYVILSFKKIIKI